MRKIILALKGKASSKTSLFQKGFLKLLVARTKEWRFASFLVWSDRLLCRLSVVRGREHPT